MPYLWGILFIKKALNNHIKKDKHSDLTYSCEQCDKKILKKSNLGRHRKTIHEPNTYPCAKCGKRFLR